MKTIKLSLSSIFLPLISCLLFLGAASTYAQDWQWIKDGGSSDSATHLDEQVIDMVTDSDRNVYVISEVGNNGLTIDGQVVTGWDDLGQYPKDIALASFSCDGSFRWSKIIGGYAYDIVKSVQIDSQDNVYIVGRFAGYQSTQYPPRIDSDFIMVQSPADNRLLFLAKFDKNGVFQWIKRPQDAVVPSTDMPLAMSLQMSIDANDVIHWFVRLDEGNSYANNTFTDNLTGKNIYRFKYDTNGNFINATHFDFQSSNGGEGGYIKMYRNPYNNNYYMMFRKNSSASVVSVNGTTIVNATFIACYDTNGVFQWIRESNTAGAPDVTLHGLAFDPSNNIYVAGKMTGFGTGTTFLGFTVPENLIPAFVLKVNPTADTLLWSTYNNSDSYNFAGLLYHNGEIAYTGTGFTPTFTWGNMSLDINPLGTGTDILFARFNAQTGGTLLLDAIASDNGSADYGTAITVDTNGDYLVGGAFGHYIYDMHGNQNINAGGSSDFFVAKYATGACNALSTNEEQKNSNINIYPNPVKNKLYITAQDNIQHIAVYSVLGQEVLSKKEISNNNMTIDTSNLKAGTYFVKVEVNGSVGTYKFIKE